ncbi:MAG: hypothetical protein KTR14_04430 [Vampirovibrio sp.]|nr:hypothetical protein [Vampirovibrio sp.]
MTLTDKADKINTLPDIVHPTKGLGKLSAKCAYSLNTPLLKLCSWKTGILEGDGGGNSTT